MITSSKNFRRMVGICLNPILIGIVIIVLVGCSTTADRYDPNLVTNETDNRQSDNYMGVVTSTGQYDSYPTAITTSSTESISSYPVPTASHSLPENAPYPSPTIATGILLALDKPIVINDGVVTGVGPPGLQVHILNITFMGDLMGSGIIEQDGTFTITVPELLVGTRIGLAADVMTIGLQEEDIEPGENTISVPQVGYFYDSYVIRE